MQLTAKQKIHANLSGDCQEKQTEIKQELDLPNLYNFLQSLKYESAQRNISTITFQNRNLIDVGKSIVGTLNKVQAYYHKYYVGAICVFVCIINIPSLCKLTSCLKRSFFRSLAPILADILQFWRLNEQTDKNAAGRAKIIAYFKSLHEIGSKTSSMLPRVYNQDVLNILGEFQLPNDQTIIKLYSKLVFQALKVEKYHNNRQSKKFAINLYEALRHTNFPVSILNRCLLYYQAKLKGSDLVSSANKKQIFNNLKKMLQVSLKDKIELIDSNRLVTFINSLQITETPAWNLPELCRYCKMSQLHNGEGREQKRKFLKQIAANIICFEQSRHRQEVDDILEFGCTFCELDIMEAMMVKMSSVRLVKLVLGGFLGKLIQILTDPTKTKVIRLQGFKLMSYLEHRMVEINYALYWQIKLTNEGLKQIIRQQQNGLEIENNAIKIPYPGYQFSLQ